MKRTIFQWIYALVTLLGMTAMAQSTAVLPVRAISLDAPEADVLAQLIGQQYSKVSGQSVIDAAAVAGSAPSGNYLEAAQSLGATEVLETSALGLQGRKRKAILINVTRKSVQGQVIHQVELRADTMEDAVIVTERLADALYNRTDVTTRRTRHNVTLLETDRQNRLRSEALLGVKTAVIAPVAPIALSPMATLGFDARLERESYFLEFGAGAMLPALMGSSGSYGGLYTELGASYFVNASDVGVYVGGGALVRLIFGGYNGLNVAPYGQIGVTLTRDASTRFYVDLRVAQSILPMSMYTAGGSGNIYPTEIGLQAGIGF